MKEDRNRILGLLGYLHFLIFALGLIVWVHSATTWYFKKLKVRQPLPGFFAWSEYFNFPDKPAVIIAFVAVSVALVAYTLAWMLFLSRKNPSVAERLTGGTRGEFYQALPFGVAWLLLLTVFAVFRHSIVDRIVILGVCGFTWSLGLGLPWVEFYRRLKVATPFWDRSLVYFSRGVLVICLAINVWMFGPLLIGKIRLLNDQLKVPEYTILAQGPVENTKFIREHRIFGLSLAEENPKALVLAERRSNYQTPVQPSKLLSTWLEQHRGVLFEKDQGILTFVDKLRTEDFLSLFLHLEDDSDLRAVRKLYSVLYNSSERKYSDLENEFIKKNWSEFRWQILNRWAIHHHNFVYGPINEFRLGKPLNQISFQYGFLNGIGLLALTKVFGGFTLENYFRATFLFYPLYFLLLIVVGFLILKDGRYVALLAMLALSSMLLLDYEKIVRAPGLSPLRHFMDLFVIYAATIYWRNRSRWLLLLSYALALGQIALNREFGLFLLGALVAVEFFSIISTGMAKRKFELSCILAAIGGSGIVLFVLRLVSNSMASYYSNGFASPPLPGGAFTVSLAVFAFMYGLCVWPGLISREYRNILLFLTFYSNGLFLYYIWGASPPHFQNLFPIYALAAVVALKALADCPIFDGYEKWVLSIGQAATMVALLIPAICIFSTAKSDFDEVFKNHVVHDWRFSRARVESTADPKPYAEAVELVERYEPSAPGIWVISVLDNIIPFLADRYSAMPYFDLSWFLLTNKEFALVESAVKEARPRHLFVDHDITFDHSGEVVDPAIREDDGYIRSESVLRIRRLQVMQALFKKVSVGYKKVAESILWDVYELQD